MEQVKLYDTTLRDGMGGHGMSLSVGEKLKVVQALDALGVQFDRGRLSQLQPEGSRALRAARRDRAGAGDDRRLRHDPPPRPQGRGRRGARRPGRQLRPGRLPGRQELGPAPGEGDQGLRRGEPGDDRRLDRLLPRAGQAPDLRRRALLRRLPRRPRLRAGMRSCRGGGRRRERHPLRHQRRQPAGLRRRGDRRRGHGARRRGRGRHPHPRRRRLRRRQLARRGGSGRSSRAGHRQRLRRALRQRQPGERSCRRCS